ncbi:putative integrin beta-3 [Ixodes scapularis]
MLLEPKGSWPTPMITSFPDYPSLSQIVSVVQRSKINLIFAVPEGAYDVYRQLSAFIDGSSVGKLVGDSSNIVHLVRDQYYKIRSEVVLKDNAPWFLRVNYSSKCLSGTEAKNKQQTNACGGIRVGDEVEFQVSVELVNCPADASSHVFRISPVGVNEYVEVQVEPICSCDCEAPQRTETNSSRCNGRGSSACGVCSCDPNFYGKQCECLDTELQLHKALCQASNSSTELCSNRGDCVCGECQCYNPQVEFQVSVELVNCPADASSHVFRISPVGVNEYVEVQVEPICSCDCEAPQRTETNSSRCNGRGSSACGVCSCDPNFYGKQCECLDTELQLHKALCQASNSSTELCSNRGDCVCGECQCYNPQDYPSLSQIVSVVQRSKINLIFAVPEGAYDVYRQLSAFIDGSSVGKLVGDSSNIVHLVRDQYYKIRSEVVLKDNAPWFLRVNYSSKCLSGTEAKNKQQTNACGGIRVGDEV